MLRTNIKRVFKSGFLNFWRNGSVSFTAVIIMTMALLVVGSLLLTQALLNSTLTQIKNKVDINVYLVTSADEKEIKRMKKVGVICILCALWGHGCRGLYPPLDAELSAVGCNAELNEVVK